VAPTLLDYVGAKLPPELEGDSLMPLIRGQARQLAHPEVVLSTQMNDVHAIRVGDLKYILRLPDREELYDLRSDPDEQHNLVASEPEQARALRERLAAFVRPGARGSRPPDNRLREDPRMNELLERLGYAEEAPAPDGGAEAPQR
jgi:arylsulfatase A-like enzyme